MTEINFNTYIEGVKNDVKIAVDDVFAVLEKIGTDVESIKVKTSKPDKLAASLLLDYLGWDKGKSRQNLEKLCGKEIEQYLKWLEYHCKKEGLTHEQALREIIEG